MSPCFAHASNFRVKRQLSPPQPGGLGCQSDNECEDSHYCNSGACLSRKLTDEMLAKIEAGDVSLQTLEALDRDPNCHPLPGLQPTLKRIEDTEERNAFVSELAGNSSSVADRSDAFVQWLQLADNHVTKCPGDVNREHLIVTAQDSNVSVTEAFVDTALQQPDCAALTSVNRLRLWPFERRLVHEVSERKFQQAEVTRRLWLDTLKTFSSVCKEQLSRREATTVTTSIDKLDRIVGLDDDVLIGLRDKLMTAMENGDADSVRAYVDTIAKRERFLIAANASKSDVATTPAAVEAPEGQTQAEDPIAEAKRKLEDKVKDEAKKRALDAARKLFQF